MVHLNDIVNGSKLVLAGLATAITINGCGHIDGYGSRWKLGTTVKETEKAYFLSVCEERRNNYFMAEFMELSVQEEYKKARLGRFGNPAAAFIYVDSHGNRICGRIEQPKQK